MYLLFFDFWQALERKSRQRRLGTPHKPLELSVEIKAGKLASTVLRGRGRSDALELSVRWLYKHDAALKLPYQEHLSALIYEPGFRAMVGEAIFTKTRVLKELGMLAVHSHKAIRTEDALTAARELFHLLFWLAHTYARRAKPADELAFDSALLPRTSPALPQPLVQLQAPKGPTAFSVLPK